MALVKYNNNSISAVTSASSIPSGAITHIKTLTASSSATLSFVHGTDGVVLDSTYPIYKFEFINIHPANNDARISFQGSTNGGSSYGVTITSSAFRAGHRETDTTTFSYTSGEGLAQSTSFQPLGNGIGNEADETGSGILKIFNPSSTTFVKHFMSQFNGYQGGNWSIVQYIGGYFNTTSALNAFQFKMDSGNIDSGKIKLYGIKDS